MIEKLDLISWNIGHLKKEKLTQQRRLLALEEASPNFITHHHFQRQMQEQTHELFTMIKGELEEVDCKFKKHKEASLEMKEYFNKMMVRH